MSVYVRTEKGLQPGNQVSNVHFLWRPQGQKNTGRRRGDGKIQVHLNERVNQSAEYKTEP